MKSEMIRVAKPIADEIRRISDRLETSNARASIVVFFDLTDGKPVGHLNLEEFRLRFWRKKLKGKVAMTL